jgi:hypothetical protein
MAGNTFEREFKIAPVGRRVKCRVTAEGAEIVGATSGKRVSSCEFSKVRHGRFTEISLGDFGLGFFGSKMTSRYLRLSGHHQHFKLQQNGGQYDKKGLDLVPFYESCAATLRGLAAANPDAKINIGPGVALRWTWFFIGIAATLVGGLSLLTVFGGVVQPGSVTQDAMLDLTIVGIILTPLGISSMIRFRPWSQKDLRPAADLAADIEGWLQNRD